MKTKVSTAAQGGQQKLTPSLWFNDNAEGAARFYISIFDNSKIVEVTYYGEAGPGPKGTVMSVRFELDGQEFIAINAGPQFRFTEAVSFVVNCTTQKEADRFWEKLTDGGEEGRCGWLKDKYGLSWQVVPTNLPKLLAGNDPEKSGRVMKAMLQMKKIDIETLLAA
jgi:predicted 3-demethylubiquinone-9 3-methyltransferase (glyoxalase superfamily)